MCVAVQRFAYVPHYFSSLRSEQKWYMCRTVKHNISPWRSTQKRSVVCLHICGVLSEAGAWLFQSVSETGFGLTALGIAVWFPKGTETFIYSTSPRTAPGSTQFPAQCVPEEAGGMKWPTREADLSLPTKHLRKIGGCVSPLRTRIHAWYLNDDAANVAFIWLHGQRLRWCTCGQHVSNGTN
jgi:hypothetical protein